MIDFIKSLYTGKYSRIMKFITVGGLNTAADYAVFIFLTYFLLWNTTLAQGISFVVGMVISYVLNRSWTFETKESFFGTAMVKFLLLNLSTLCLSMYLMHLFEGVLNMHALVAKVIITVITSVISYTFNKIIFKN